MKTTDHPLYRKYRSMISRCRYPSNENYSRYGGRGIKVCERWQSNTVPRNSVGFWNFVEDMGDKPSPAHTLDRKNPDGDYEPNNCRWATVREQANNKRMYKTNKTGVTGVIYNQQSKKYTARIHKNGKRIHLGYFGTIKLAVIAQQKGI